MMLDLWKPFPEGVGGIACEQLLFDRTGKCRPQYAMDVMARTR
jgi:hypothetical protein